MYHEEIKVLKGKQIFPQGVTPVKLYHSAVPHENSAFKNVTYVGLILYCQHISCIVSYISYLLKCVTRVRH